MAIAPAVPHRIARRCRCFGKRRAASAVKVGYFSQDQLDELAAGETPLDHVRALAPTLPLLIPGIGAQGGDAEATVRAGWRADAPIIVSSSRAILYASDRPYFAEAARRVAQATRQQLNAARGVN